MLRRVQRNQTERVRVVEQWKRGLGIEAMMDAQHPACASLIPHGNGDVDGSKVAPSDRIPSIGYFQTVYAVNLTSDLRRLAIVERWNRRTIVVHLHLHGGVKRAEWSEKVRGLNSLPVETVLGFYMCHNPVITLKRKSDDKIMTTTKLTPAFRRRPMPRRS